MINAVVVPPFDTANSGGPWVTDKQQKEMDIDRYLEMQHAHYQHEASRWSVANPDPVVGWYHRHNAWTDYDTVLFRDIDTTGLKALEYGCGPGRNLVRFHDRFASVDGVDISGENVRKAYDNLEHHGYAKDGVSEKHWVFQCDGQSVVPLLGAYSLNDNYDVVFAVICLQHIAVHNIRYAIMEDIYRVLKPGGYFCFQMGFGGRSNSVGYFDNYYDATGTNGACDVTITNEDDLKNDLDKIGYKNYNSVLRPPCCDEHKEWIWVKVQK